MPHPNLFRWTLATLALSTWIAGCQFGLVRQVIVQDDFGGDAIATDYNGNRLFFSTTDPQGLYKFDLATGIYEWARSVPDAYEIVALAQNPWDHDSVLSLHANGAIVTWDEFLNYALVTRLPANAPADVSFVDLDASAEGDIFVLATRPDGNSRKQYLLRHRADAWSVQYLGTFSGSAERIAFDDENDRILVLVDRNQRSWDTYDTDLQLLWQTRPAGIGAATDLDVIDGVVIVGGNDTMSIIQDTENGGFVVDDTTAPLGQVIDSVVFAADPVAATFEAVARGGVIGQPSDTVQAVAVE